MRDIALLAFFIIAVPFMLKRPSLGVIMWIWLSVMNPHRLTYGFAYDMQFAALTAAVTFAGLCLSKEEKSLPLTPPVIVMLMFTVWMCLTSLFPFHDGSGYDMWSRVMKIMLMNFVALTVIKSKQQIHWVVWTIVVSLAYYGAKGGLFTLVNGGSYLVWGPAGSFIEGNNEVALAFVIVIPLMRYLQIGFQKRWQRWAMSGTMLLTALAAIGSHSRGALVAIAAMAIFMWWKSRNKAAMGIVLVAAAFLIFSFMPAEWVTRMHTIQTYDEDQSALGRINAWSMAFHMALDRPLGGGYDIYDPDTFGRYAPNPLDVHAAHSIYFQVMGEHGFIGLFLFMLIGLFTWFAAGDAKRRAKGIAGLEWVRPLVDMMKVSMVGYAVGGAFLSLAYFDVPYFVMVVIVATQALTLKAQRALVVPKRDRFGSVVIGEEPSDVVADVPARTPRDEWRGDPVFARRALAAPGGDRQITKTNFGPRAVDR